MEKINIAELLKDCPKGMELDCTLFEAPVTYDGYSSDETYSITILTKEGEHYYLTDEGYIYDRINSKCVIFPKGKTTWEGFQRPAKDGDVVVCEEQKKITQMFIVQSKQKEGRGKCYFGYDFENDDFFEEDIWEWDRLATEEEKAKLFDAIKANGYKWNAETKTLEKLIVPNKFDITTLKPFDKVLARATDNSRWIATLFSHLRGMTFYTVSGWYNQCIPFQGNEHLLGKTDDCDEIYKTWE